MNNISITRRRFLGGAAAAAALTAVPRHVLSRPRRISPNDKLNIACIGVGGMGAYDIDRLAGENIVALCDVDWKHAAGTFKKFPNAKKYRDFRKMLDAEDKNIDAVSVSTPDHTHAVASMAAMQRNKHVYCQKPLCHDVAEVRRLTEAARKYGVVTQMGTQLHATSELKRLVEMIQSGLIGQVRRVDLWSGKNWGGGTRPTDTPPVPETLEWDLWLGPAPYRPYHPTYLPANWRRWWDFGTGTLGDMGCHIIDPAWWALNLDAPRTVEAQAGPFSDETYPTKTIITWEFPARGDRAAVTLRWFDGENRPPRPAELEEGVDLPGQGGLYYGDKGTILMPHGGSPRMIPDSKMSEVKMPEPWIPRFEEGSNGHYLEWIQACKGGRKPLSNFDYAGPLTEAILLGNVAVKAGRKIEWDSPAMKVTNMPEMDRYISREYREGWSL